MFPLLALAALTAFGAYNYGKNKQMKKQLNAQNTANATKTETDTAKNVNTYNYYTNDSETGNTLFGSEKKTKRTLFGNSTTAV
jgi:hypothetical protein